MNEPPKAFNPQDYEQKLYSMWEKSGVFNPDNLKLGIRNSKTFSVIMPPPNANGSLHIGHAVGMTIEDIMVRFHRMRGEPTLWLPGADHAGFETQVVYERELEKKGKTRFEFTREQLYSQMWDFTQKNRKIMESQIRALGASCDWTRRKFTLDSNIVETVYNTFKKLYDDGLAYRDLGIVNWCPKHQTSLSDLEVKYTEQTNPLYYLKYGPFTIATARPETKFGDKYVVVHPKDKRYNKFKHGQQFKADWINGQVVATLIKDEAIDMSFGTGAMTITPWHDATDFEIAKRHNLKFEQVIGFDTRLTKVAGRYAGQKIAVAREAIVNKLKQKKLIVKIDESYSHSVARCYKCNSLIEPQALTQWFVAMRKKVNGKSLQDIGNEAIAKKQVNFVTRHHEKIYRYWLANIRDWNVSRQIVWGIPINAWYCARCGKVEVAVPKTLTILAMRHGESEHNIKGVLSGDPKVIYHLTAKGRGQAKELAIKLKDRKFDIIYVSEFLRTQETAQEIIKGRKIKMQVDPRLNDIKSGSLEGKEMATARTESKVWSVGVGGSETLPDIQNRVASFLRDIAVKHNGGRVAVLTSEVVLHSLQRLSHGLAPDEKDILHFKTGEVEELSVTLPVLCPSCHGLLKRDQDVFDTWFSSGQWPFATLKITGDFEKFYPTSVMETGHDILFFWVARMIMLGIYVTGKPPFKHVFLHGLVRDKDRQKMSKSKGNVIDPLGVASQYGTDSVRMALVYGNAPGSDIVISEEKIRGMRNFANKVWNINRFIVMNLNSKVKMQNSKLQSESQNDRKIIKQLNDTVKTVTNLIQDFQFHQAAEIIYDFIWHKFADEYIEASKNNRNDQVLIYVLTSSLTILHPFMPFVTEAIWQELFERKLVKEPMLINAPWPEN